jgi:hypothetical protein
MCPCLSLCEPVGMWTNQGKYVHNPMHDFIAGQIVAHFWGVGILKFSAVEKHENKSKILVPPVHALDGSFHALDRFFHGLATLCPWWGLKPCFPIMFWKLCRSLLNWLSSTGCVDNHSCKKLNYNGTSSPLRLSTESFSTGWYLPGFGFYTFLSSIVSLQKHVDNDMSLGCAHLEPLLQHPSLDRSQDWCLGLSTKYLYAISDAQGFCKFIRNPFAWTGVEQQNGCKIAISLRQTEMSKNWCNKLQMHSHLARNEGRTSRTDEKLQFWNLRCNRFARNESRTAKTVSKNAVLQRHKGPLWQGFSV